MRLLFTIPRFFDLLSAGDPACLLCSPAAPRSVHFSHPARPASSLPFRGHVVLNNSRRIPVTAG